MKKIRKVKRAAKDPHAPKRPMCSYFLWLNENREEITDSMPGNLVGKGVVLKKAATMWKKVSATEKAKYSAMFRREQKAYAIKLQKYRKSEKYLKFAAKQQMLKDQVQ